LSFQTKPIEFTEIQIALFFNITFKPYPFIPKKALESKGEPAAKSVSNTLSITLPHPSSTKMLPAKGNPSP